MDSVKRVSEEDIGNYHQYSLLKEKGTPLSEQDWEQIGIITEGDRDYVMAHAEMGDKCGRPQKVPLSEREHMGLFPWLTVASEEIITPIHTSNTSWGHLASTFRGSTNLPWEKWPPQSSFLVIKFRLLCFLHTKYTQLFSGGNIFKVPLSHSMKFKFQCLWCGVVSSLGDGS